ncbi:myosin-10 [Anoplophora glabripennis]|uniref:myosin-10 n=1 Tax=Anoplophora glabripennis TaxID=217634 RepID=UPI000874255F|nr:myosin-10 [Anoplophora glabripennis]
MGNATSNLFGDNNWWTSAQNNCDSTPGASAIQNRGSPNPDDDKRASRELSEPHKERLDEFKLELARKHEKRRQILQEKRMEMEELREEVVRLKKENQELRQASAVKCDSVPDSVGVEIERLRKENECLRDVLEEKSKLLEASDDIIERNRELRVSIAEMQRELQNLNKQVVDFEKERQDYQAHVVALKDVIAVSKNMLQIRESQLKELKEKVENIEQSLAGREMNILSQDLRNEYERQLQNIRNLRTLYEERQRVHKREKDELVSQLDDVRKELATEQTRVRELEERIRILEEDSSKKYDEIKTLESNLGLTKAESRQYQAELTVINQLFSEILLGFNSSQDIDLDKLQKQLEDHRDLLQDIVINEISPEVSSALPKVLLELLSQVDEDPVPKEDGEEAGDGKLETIKEESESQTSSVHQMNSAEEIVENLPKVWKVLIELLSHQKAPTNNLTDDEEDDNPCYKTVQTPKGPSVVLSVSQTFIRLKNLILEKKSLEKETNHLKQLNGHLENRLQDQEKRLELVQSELSKTWLVVGKLQKQHQMLHTQEKILRYELAQKRKLLTELKEELEYSREKWTQAREKNSNTEQQWKLLRTEFASRRNTVANDNSVESGYSDDRESSSSDEEPGYETDLSECTQKASGSDDLSDNKEIVGGATILALIEDEIVEIVCADSNDVHSELKTDSVQNQEKFEKTGECRSVPDTNIEAAGTSTEDSRFKETAEDVAECVVPEANVEIEEELSIGTSQNEPSESEESHESETTRIPEEDDRSRGFLEEVLAQRDARLRRMEGQAEQLVTMAANTANRSVVISSRLDDLHDTYGQSSSELVPIGNVVRNDEDVDVRPTEDNQE